MMEEANRRNEEELTEDDQAKNLVWKVGGKKGQRRLIKGFDQNRGQETQPRGVGGTRRMSRGRGAGMSRGSAPERSAGGARMDLLETRGRARGWVPGTRGRGRAGRGAGEGEMRRKRSRNSPGEEQDPPSQLSQTTRGNKERRGMGASRILTGSNAVEVSQIPEVVVEGGQEDSAQEEEEENVINMADSEESDSLEGLRLGALSQQQL